METFILCCQSNPEEAEEEAACETGAGIVRLVLAFQQNFRVSLGNREGERV